MESVASRKRPSGEAGSRPICRTQFAAPCPSPAMNRPGKAPARVANSIAVAAGCLTAAATTPSPIGIRLVAASAVATDEMPPSWK